MTVIDLSNLDLNTVSLDSKLGALVVLSTKHYIVRVNNERTTLRIELDLPGIPRSEINVESLVSDTVNTISVSASRDRRSFDYSVSLKNTFDLDKITATSVDGTLILSVPLKSTTKRKISVAAY